MTLNRGQFLTHASQKQAGQGSDSVIMSTAGGQ